jgi:hypothetical protein
MTYQLNMGGRELAAENMAALANFMHFSARSPFFYRWVLAPPSPAPIVFVCFLPTTLPVVTIWRHV